MSRRLCCPQCGSEDLQVSTETTPHTTGKNYSAGKGCLGYLLFGPLGLLCGSCGKGQQTKTTNTTYWICPRCGKKFRNPEELSGEITKQKKDGYIVIIICTVAALLMGILLEPIDLSLALFCGIAMFLGGGFGAFANYLEVKKKQKELDEIESGIDHFKK